MIIAYGILAVPTGIFSYELARVAKSSESDNRKCPHCSAEGHTKDANYCYRCGGQLSTNG